jgi:hypothetical protein
MSDEPRLHIPPWVSVKLLIHMTFLVLAKISSFRQPVASYGIAVAFNKAFQQCPWTSMLMLAPTSQVFTFKTPRKPGQINNSRVSYMMELT